MADLADIKRLRVEDFPDAPDWAKNLFEILNVSFEDLYKALNNDLTLSENSRAFYKDLTLDGAQFPITFGNEISVKPVSVSIAQITELDANGNSVVITLPVTIDWEDTNEGIKINNITNLSGGTNYKILFLVIGDKDASIS